MLWHWSKEKPSTEASLPRANLRSILGLAGRLLFSVGTATNHMTSVPCTVTGVSRSEIKLDLSTADVVPPAESAVILEVAQQTAMIQCFTVVRSKGPGSRVTLRTPGQPHVLQRRRFPRVDLFLGILVTSPDRPVEQIPAQMINLSVEGAACVMVEPISPDSPLTLNLTSIGLHPPYAHSVVVRCTPTPSHLWVVGVKFENLADEQELYLGKYVSEVTQSHMP